MRKFSFKSELNWSAAIANTYKCSIDFIKYVELDYDGKLQSKIFFQDMHSCYSQKQVYKITLTFCKKFSGQKIINFGIEKLDGWANNSIRFFILNNKNDKVIERTIKDIEFKQTVYETQHINVDFIKAEANNILINNKLNILLEIYATNHSSFLIETTQDMEKLKHSYRYKEFDDFENLIDSDKFSDVKFCVDGKVIHAHKNILSVRSPVFQAMFEHDMKENNENNVEVEDIKYEVLKEVLRFIYTGKVEDIENLALDLLMAADKYALEGMKALCEEMLYKSLTFENAFVYLNLACTHNAVNLKHYIIDYMWNIIYRQARI